MCSDVLASSVQLQYHVTLQTQLTTEKHMLTTKQSIISVLFPLQCAEKNVVSHT